MDLPPENAALEEAAEQLARELLEDAKHSKQDLLKAVSLLS